MAMHQATENLQLADDVRRLYRSRAFSDFIVVTSDGQEFHVHRNVLGIRSKVFMAMLITASSKEVLTGRCEVTDVDGPTMDILLQYMYGTGDNYDLPGLVQLYAEALQTRWKTTSAADVLEAADKLKLTELKEFALSAIAKDGREFFRSGQLECVRNYSRELMEEVLEVQNSGEAFCYTCTLSGRRRPDALSLRKGFDANMVYP